MSSSASVAAVSTSASYTTEYDAVTAVMNTYSESVKTGRSEVMRASFHPAATFFGYYQGELFAGTCQKLFDWVDGNGPAPDVKIRLVNVDIHNTIAVVRVEMENLRGKLSVPEGATLSDLFQLIKIDGQWKISQKSFHWH
jgi:Putative lumazine-binding